MARSLPVIAGTVLVATLVACVQKAPPDLLEKIKSLDRQLSEVQAAEYAPEEYAQFVEHWITLQSRVLADDDTIRWPWEPNTLAAELWKVEEEGAHTVSSAIQRRDGERLDAERRVAALERRLGILSKRLEEAGSRIILGRRSIEPELLVRQARSFLNQGLYVRSTRAAQQASPLIKSELKVLSAELGRYTNEQDIQLWQQMVREAMAWSRRHQAAAIVVSKADRRLILYRDGRVIVSYPVRLGYNARLEKCYQGDGATPEGWYRVIRKRATGQTQFHRALLLDYPNQDDRRRFHEATVARRLPGGARIGGQIEIHGEPPVSSLSLTLGCVMLTNAEIDALFEQVHVGTPVTIVGALDRTNSIASLLTTLNHLDES